MKILIVDDQQINLFLLEELLSDRYQTFTALSGQKALQIALSERPDLVLLDIMMPEMDGYEVLRHIRQNPLIKNTIVIMVTAKVDKEAIKSAFMLGADDYLKKPIDATDLFTKLNVHQQILHKNKEIAQFQVYANIYNSMALAQQIQNALLPDKAYFNQIFPKSFRLFMPKDLVSGDFYYITQQGNQKFISVIDCIGHGVPAAMLTMITFMALSNFVSYNQITQPSIVAKQIQAEIATLFSKSNDIYTITNGLEATFCELDSSTNILNFCGAHRPMVILRNKNTLVINDQVIDASDSFENWNLFFLKGDGFNIHSDANTCIFTNYKIELELGDRIYLFTDGYTDQMGGGNHKRLSKKEFLSYLLRIQKDSIESQKVELYNNFMRWMGTLEQTDDVLIIGIEI